jgi:hypothetical protein
MQIESEPVAGGQKARLDVRLVINVASTASVPVALSDAPSATSSMKTNVFTG